MNLCRNTPCRSALHCSCSSAPAGVSFVRNFVFGSVLNLLFCSPIIKAPSPAWPGPEFKDLCEKSCFKDLKNDLYSSRPVAAEHCSSSSLKMYVSTLERDACRSVGVVFIPCCQWWVKWKTWSQIKESWGRLKKAQNDVVSRAVWQYRSTQLTQFSLLQHQPLKWIISTCCYAALTLLDGSRLSFVLNVRRIFQFMLDDH